MESRTEFVVSGRLIASKAFAELQVRGRHGTLAAAQERLDEWIEGKKLLAKAKPEGEIQAESIPHLADCNICGVPLFRDEVVYAAFLKYYCYECAYSSDVAHGMFCLMGMS